MADLNDTSSWIPPIVPPVVEQEKKSDDHGKPDDINLEDLLKLNHPRSLPCTCCAVCLNAKVTKAVATQTDSERLLVENPLVGATREEGQTKNSTEYEKKIESCEPSNSNYIPSYFIFDTELWGKYTPTFNYSGEAKVDQLHKLEKNFEPKFESKIMVSDVVLHKTDYVLVTDTNSSSTPDEQFFEDVDKALNLLMDSLKDVKCDQTVYSVGGVQVKRFLVEQGTPLSEVLATDDPSKTEVFFTEKTTCTPLQKASDTSTQEVPAKTDVLVAQEKTSENTTTLRSKIRAKRRLLAQARQKSSQKFLDVGSGKGDGHSQVKFYITETGLAEAKKNASKNIPNVGSGQADGNSLVNIMETALVQAKKKVSKNLPNVGSGQADGNSLVNITETALLQAKKKASKNLPNVGSDKAKGNSLSKPEIMEMAKADKAENSTDPSMKEIENKVTILDQESLNSRMEEMKLSPLETSTYGKPEVVRNRQKKRRICMCCGLEEPAPKTFKKCKRCKDEGLSNPPFYCGRNCQIKDWSVRHRQDHERLCSKDNWLP